MSEMVKRVVAAMRATDLDCAGWDADTLAELARAAIAAMREPTDDMLSAAGPFSYGPLIHWENMIDEALR